MHRYEPTEYADNNLQCSHALFWHGISKLLIQPKYKIHTRHLAADFLLLLLLLLFFLCFQSFILLFYFILFYFILFIYYYYYYYYYYYFILFFGGWEKVKYAPVICIPGPPRAGDISSFTDMTKKQCTVSI